MEKEVTFVYGVTVKTAPSVASGSGGLKTVNAEVVAVMEIDTYASCRNCNGKV